MPTNSITFKFKKFPDTKPDYKGSVLTFHPCEGYQVIEWDGECFRLWNGIDYPQDMVHLWHELPDEMTLYANIAQSVTISIA